MTYNSRQRETLHRLGIKQLPTLQASRYTPELDDPFRSTFVIGDLPVRTMPVPGRRCPACAAKGETVWVIPGKRCPQCGTQVN
ncbi:uncharacterized protein LTR77_001187 [Saxophila tyrrhenica]|uniref:Uncharacterized protein n=1 Tax=Saxophila tyrrhenica TaxID=1690608 RepID=A0AAV9PLD9_9PEZI|nr:hypothetical protein LTR77_001187 [Saxophila tyrrhenica]